MYATAEEFVASVGAREAGDLCPAAGGGVDLPALSTALTAAGDEIDGWLAGRYALPAAIARAHAIAIARYRLTSDAPPEGRVGRDYASAIAYLRDVAQGKTALVPEPTGPTGGATVLIASPGRIFGGRW